MKSYRQWRARGRRHLQGLEQEWRPVLETTLPSVVDTFGESSLHGPSIPQTGQQWLTFFLLCLISGEHVT